MFIRARNEGENDSEGVITRITDTNASISFPFWYSWCDVILSLRLLFCANLNDANTDADCETIVRM